MPSITGYYKEQIDAFRAEDAATYLPRSSPMLVPAGGLARNYDSCRNVYGFDASALRRYRAARGAAGEGGTNLCRIAFVGDSQTGGTGSTPAAQSFPRIVSNRLAALGFPLASKGTAALSYKETAADSRYSFTSGWANLGVGTDAMGFLTNSNTNPLTYTSDTVGTVVELAMLGNASPVTVTIDGVAKGTTTPSGQQNNQIFTYTGLADTAHTVVITPTSSDSAHVLWVDVREPSGISILNAGIGGSRAQQWAAGNFYGARAIVKGFAPTLVMLTLGTNDLLAGRTAAQFETDLATVATDLGTGRDLILGTPVNGNNLDFTAYRAAIYAVADALNVPVIDLGDRLGTFATANGNGLMTDDYHPRARGYHDLGTSIGALLAE